MIRFTETNKWTDPWFRSLSPASKLLFIFIVDSCNNAGFWEEDKSFACFATGMTEAQYSGAIKGLSRGLLGANGWMWVRTFLKHQKNASLNPENNAHLQILRLLNEQVSRFSEVEEFRGFIAPYEPLLRGLGISKGRSKGAEEEVQEEKPKRTKTPRPGGWTEEEMKELAVKNEMPESDGSAFYLTCKASGWKLSKGNPIKDIEAHFQNYKRNNWLDSQKSKTNGNTHQRTFGRAPSRAAGTCNEGATFSDD